ncbi:SPOR domain-containing protein [Aurantibacter crassamenti]|uniref:HU domain-containing protein n=1 Tax=Aurantibacter crassamenti TaxID=1837375 RepID=UPI0019399B39|nr:SPOR domain-containing protein [Aurantibacter crassamenti]MBM1105301.1 SPOR domain-containing protein [Aurantibacter crassamenti]
MVLEHYISELLYRYNCVVVPEFGAFLTQRKSAGLHKTSNTFYPPSKTLSFNNQLTSNDGLLVSYMANAENVSYEAMLKKVTETANEWKASLLQGNRITLENIGVIWLNSEQKMQFQPSDKINYLTSSFGLSTFVAAPVTREVLKEEVQELEERIPFIITPEQRETVSFRPYLKYAAIFLLALSVGFTGYRTFNEMKYNKQVAFEEAQVQVSKTIQEATFFDTSPLELPVLELEAESVINPSFDPKSPEKTHHIIAGAFRFEKNAQRKIRQLKRRGYNAAYLGTNDFGLHIVTYESFKNPQEALNHLQQIRRTQSKDAWLKSVK